MALQLDIPSATGTSATFTDQLATKNPSDLTMLKRQKVSATDRMFFTEQLSLLLATGTSLHPALQSIATQVKSLVLKIIVEDIAEGVMAGRSLSEEMAQHPQAFSPMYVNLIGASEAGGFLAEVLEQLRNIEEQNENLRSTLVGAFSYPAFLVAFSIFALMFILLVVFPKFSDMFAGIGDQLPGTTKALMGMSSFLIAFWIETLIGFAVAIAAIIWGLRLPAGRRFADRTKLYAPILNSVWRRVYVVILFRVLGTSLDHGVSLVDAVKTSLTLVNNNLVTGFLTNLSERLEQGERLGTGVQAADWIPDLAKQMLITGEESGSLAAVMMRMSTHYDRELNRALQQFSRMIEPIMLVVMGAMVGLLVSSLILPIFKLSSSVS